MPELKAYPFCREGTDIELHPDPQPAPWFRYSCEECGCESSGAATPEEARYNWNTRAGQPSGELACSTCGDTGVIPGMKCPDCATRAGQPSGELGLAVERLTEIQTMAKSHSTQYWNVSVADAIAIGTVLAALPLPGDIVVRRWEELAEAMRREIAPMDIPDIERVLSIDTWAAAIYAKLKEAPNGD